MEKAGFIRVLEGLLDKDVNIETISTDRHNQIRKLMRVDPRFNHIQHVIDPWHLIKGLKKKLNAKAKKKGCEIIGKFKFSVYILL